MSQAVCQKRIAWLTCIEELLGENLIVISGRAPPRIPEGFARFSGSFGGGERHCGTLLRIERSHHQTFQCGSCSHGNILSASVQICSASFSCLILRIFQSLLSVSFNFESREHVQSLGEVRMYIATGSLTTPNDNPQHIEKWSYIPVRQCHQ